MGNGTIAVVPMMEHVLSVVVADGMSRVGSHLQPDLPTIEKAVNREQFTTFCKNGKHQVQFPQGHDSVALLMQTEVEGMGYSIRGGSGYFAILIMLLYLAVAISHTWFVLKFSVSSSAWKSLSAMMMLIFGSHLGSDGPLTSDKSLNNAADVMVKVENADGTYDEKMFLVKVGNTDRVDIEKTSVVKVENIQGANNKETPLSRVENAEGGDGKEKPTMNRWEYGRGR